MLVFLLQYFIVHIYQEKQGMGREGGLNIKKNLRGGEDLLYLAGVMFKCHECHKCLELKKKSVCKFESVLFGKGRGETYVGN